jgi:hypothetical protein
MVTNNNHHSLLNREDLQDRKEKMLSHLAAKQLDSVMDREEVVLDCGYRDELLSDNHEVHLYIFFAVLKIFAV